MNFTGPPRTPQLEVPGNGTVAESFRRPSGSHPLLHALVTSKMRPDSIKLGVPTMVTFPPSEMTTLPMR